MARTARWRVLRRASIIQEKIERAIRFRFKAAHDLIGDADRGSTSIRCRGRHTQAVAMREATHFSRVFRAYSPLLHIFQITFVGPNASPKDIVSQREHNIEVPVQVSVMQAVMSCKKLIERPGAEDPLLLLVHLEMT